MLKYSLITLFLLAGFCTQAQVADSVFAVRKGNIWAMRYTLKPRENAHMIAVRYFVTDIQLDNVNENIDLRKITPGTTFLIPVRQDNYYITKQPLEVPDIHELYYRVGPKDDIGVLSTYAKVTKATMRTWNNLHGNTLTEGQVLFIGWVRIHNRDDDNPLTEQAYPPMKKVVAGDTVKHAPIPGGLDTIYNRQTNNGMNVLTEKGTAVFFENKGKSTLYFAFHNSTPRGSIIKVSNPGSGKFVYVKVLGPVPNTKLYANSIIGICEAAKEDLGVSDNKAWCELSYSPN